MVVARQTSDSTAVRIVARGNFSLDASGLLGLLAALAALTLGLAGLLAWHGYWPILPIATIQILLVSWIFVRAWKAAWVGESIEISPERIYIKHQRHKEVCRFEFDPAWTLVELEEPEIAWYAPRLYLRSRGRQLELGTFLTGQEKRQMARYLRRAIEPYSAL